MTGRHIFQFALLTGILLFSAIPSFAQPQPKDNAAYETLSYYFDLLATGNVESVKAHGIVDTSKFPRLLLIVI